MKKRKKTNKIKLIGITILLVGIILFFALTKQSIFPFVSEFSMYGVSTNQITNLNLISQNGDLVYNSKYWKIIQRDTEAIFFGDSLY